VKAVYFLLLVLGAGYKAYIKQLLKGPVKIKPEIYGLIKLEIYGLA
jgi:hypothetical protein